MTTDLESELEFHFTETVQTLIAQGWSEADARAEAERRFGDRRRYMRDLERISRRNTWSLAMSLELLILESRQALRSLRASPSFTGAALIVLTLGIGAGTAIFSVVDAVVLRGLPFDESDRLVAVGERRPGFENPEDPQALLRMAPQNYVDVVAGQQSFESMGAFTSGATVLRDDNGQPRDLTWLRVTAGFFHVLRVQPALGRGFTPDEEIEGHHFVTVLSDALWRGRFGADAGILGRTISLDGAGYQVIGVMPPSASYPVGTVKPADLWVPYFVPSAERIRRPKVLSLYLQAVARLRPGMSLRQSEAQMTQLSAALEAAYPEWNKHVSIGVRPWRDQLVGRATSLWMLMLLAAVGIVMCIACANVASLSMTRATARHREIGIRAALGAGRWRLMRQLIVESLVLSFAGAVLAVGLAWWVVGLLKAAMPATVPRIADITVNWRVLTAATVVSIVTGITFGIVPALQVSNPDLTRTLRGGRGSIGGRGQRVRQGLVIAEIALAAVLLAGAALFIGSFISVMRIDPGFNPNNVLLAQVAPHYLPGHPRPDLRADYAELVRRISVSTGVVHASMILGGTPMSDTESTTQIVVPDGPRDGETVSFRRITPDYYSALGIPLRRGRLFDDHDQPGRPLVVILSESAVRKCFAGRDPIGRPVTIDGSEHIVVGVVGDVLQTNLEEAPRIEAYVPIAYGGQSRGDLVIRTSGDPHAVIAAVTEVMHQVLPDIPLRDVRTMDENIASLTMPRRLNMLLVSLFGILGLAISAVGVYGVMAYAVAQRTREFGLRMALGSPGLAVVGLVLRGTSSLVAIGLAIGAVATWFLGAAARSFLFGVSPADPRAFVGASLAIACAAVIASVIPARRAAGVDPLTALRSE